MTGMETMAPTHLGRAFEIAFGRLLARHAGTWSALLSTHLLPCAAQNVPKVLVAMRGPKVPKILVAVRVPKVPSILVLGS